MGRWWRRKRAVAEAQSDGAEDQPASDNGQAAPGPSPPARFDDRIPPAQSAEAHDPRSEREGPDADPAPAAGGGAGTDGDVGPLASVADQVQRVLEAAEATASSIRREAEVDASRVAEERRRQRQAASELRHLWRLADALSVQAESVKRQCGVLSGLLPHAGQDEEAPTPEPAPPARQDDSGHAPVTSDDSAAPSDEAPQADGDAAGEAALDLERHRARTEIKARDERVVAYRMKLAGAGRGEIEAFLEQIGVVEAGRVTAEVFAADGDDAGP